MDAVAAGSCGAGAGAAGATLAAALHFFAASQCLVGEPWPRHAAVTNGSSFDFIVVGGGSAGATVAARLSRARNCSVLLLEAGADPPIESVIPGFRDVLKGSPYDWNFTTIDDGYSSQALSGGSQRQPRGKMLGGSGSFNDMVYSRGFPIDYDEWSLIAGDTWNFTNVIQYFKKSEHMTDERIVKNKELMKFHGLDGGIEVSGFRQTSFETQKFLQAYYELGFDVVNDMTYPNKIGAGRFSHTVRAGKRDSSLTGLLNKARKEKIFVLKDSLVTKILIENNTAIGVKVLSDDKDLHFFANKEVILSAGTFNTAKLLQLSGIGPKEHLESLDIDVVQDLPVGDNLHDHVMVLTYIAAENGTCKTNLSTTYMDMIKYFYDSSGSFSRSESMGVLVSLNNSRPNIPDFAFYPTCIPQGSSFHQGCLNIIGFNTEICKQLSAENEKHELLTIAVVLLKPKSRGKVRVNSTDPLEDPLIYSGTFENPEDLDLYPDAIELALSIADTTYFRGKLARVIDIKLDKCNDCNAREKLKCKAKAMATSAWHAVGTAAMGSVVDSHLKVIGVEGLRVVDASVMPKVIRGNTNAPVVMIAEKAADFIKQYYGVE